MTIAACSSSGDFGGLFLQLSPVIRGPATATGRPGAQGKRSATGPADANAGYVR